MRKISFKVAKAIKEAGYPQSNEKSGLTYVYPLEDHDDNFTPYTRIGKLTTNYHCQTFRVLYEIPFVVAPTYLEVWLWLWKEKKMTIDVVALAGGSCGAFIWKFDEWLNSQIKFEDPEEAIIETIEYLVDNNFIE